MPIKTFYNQLLGPMYIVCVNVTVVIEHIVLLTAARALISASYVYLRLFSVFVCLSFLSLLRSYIMYYRLPALMDISIW